MERRQERRGGKDGFAVNCTTDDQLLEGKWSGCLFARSQSDKLPTRKP